MRKPAPFILRRSTNTSGPHHLHLCCHHLQDTSSCLVACLTARKSPQNTEFMSHEKSLHALRLGFSIILDTLKGKLIVN